MKTKRFLNLMIVSLVAMTYTSCSNSDDVIVTPDPVVKTYTMTVDAQKGSNGTRALDLDGTTLNSTWTAGETVKVYEGDTELGTLTAQSTGASTSLKGTLTGDLSVDDELTLKYLSPDYNSQTGTIASISDNCDYSTATVTVSGIAGGNISTTNANFVNQQAVIKFTLKNADGSLLLTPTSFRMTDGTNTVTLTIPLDTYSTNGSGVLYVAFPASDASATITLSATAGDAVYGFGKTGITFVKGNYYGVTVKMKEISVLNGKFTVNASGDQIRFSPGNLQLVGVNSWKFADNQWDYFGNTQADNNRDLFGWGTGDNPNKTSQDNNDYATFNDWGNNSFLQAQLGTGWYTLSNDEWHYLFITRTVNGGTGAGHSYTLGQSVNGKMGVVIYPDNYAGALYTTEANWSTFEAAGCVFLPAAGSRYGNGVGNTDKGYYWSSTPNYNFASNAAYSVHITSALLYTENAPFYCSDGQSVRLVREVE